MKLHKVKVTRFDESGETEIIRSLLNVGMISWTIKTKVSNLNKFIRIAQKGERQHNIQTKKFINRYSKANETESYKTNYYLYLNAVEFAIYELNRLVEIYHHEFVAHIVEDFQIDLSRSPQFDFCKNTFKKNGIYISKIDGYKNIVELRKIRNDLKHSYIREYSLSKTLDLKSSRDFDRKILVDKVNIFFLEIPKYISLLAKEINIKYPKIEIKK